MKITMKNLGKRYEGNIEYTLEDINLEINSKEFVVLLGPSGCGKTTLLRMIAGLNSITKGDLIFGDTKVNALEPKDRNIAMVFQSYALYPHMSVYKNIAYGLIIRKVKKSIIDLKVRNVAKTLNIDHILFSKPSEISGGQRQRVALGRAIIRKPDIFLMDEPLSNLDAKLRESMRTELVKIHKMLNTTTIYVTHDQLEAMTMADKIVLFNKSKIQQMGTPKEFYEKPNNLFVANFIGSPSINLFDCVVKNNEVFYKGKKLVISDDITNKLKELNISEVVIGVRPEDLKISTKIKKGEIQGEVLNLELLGKDSIVKIILDSDNTISSLETEVINLKYGDRVSISFNENIHIFNKKTKQRINL